MSVLQQFKVTYFSSPHKERRKHRKKKTPTVAMASEQYKQKRGISSTAKKSGEDLFLICNILLLYLTFLQGDISLYSMFSHTKNHCFSEFETKIDKNHQYVTKGDHFDLNKHLEKNKKLNTDREKKTRK